LQIQIIVLVVVEVLRPRVVQLQLRHLRLGGEEHWLLRFGVRPSTCSGFGAGERRLYKIQECRKTCFHDGKIGYIVVRFNFYWLFLFFVVVSEFCIEIEL
jgi:hypothetical protein